MRSPANNHLLSVQNLSAAFSNGQGQLVAGSSQRMMTRCAGNIAIATDNFVKKQQASQFHPAGPERTQGREHLRAKRARFHGFELSVNLVKGC